MSAIKFLLGTAVTISLALIARKVWAGPLTLPPKPVSPGNGAPLPSNPLGPTHDAPIASDTATFSTRPEDIDPASFVWTDTGVGEVTAIPIKDKRTGHFARLTYADMQAVAALMQCRMLTEAEVRAIDTEASEKGMRLEPCILPAGPAMGSRAYCDKHDECVEAQLASKWDGHSAVSNAGKDWVEGAPEGKGRNFGWFRANGQPWQPASDAHADRYVDYSQLARFHK